MKIYLPEIRHDRAGFEAIVCLWTQTKASFLDDIDIDMNAATWFDAGPKRSTTHKQTPH